MIPFTTKNSFVYALTTKMIMRSIQISCLCYFIIAMIIIVYVIPYDFHD